MIILSGILILLWNIRIFLNTLSYAYLWYIKEYRFDRFFVFIKAEGPLRVLFPKFRFPPIRPKTFAVVLGSLAVLVAVYGVLPLSPILRIFIIDLISFPASAAIVFLLKLPTGFYHRSLVAIANNKIQSHKPMLVIGITGSIGKSSTKEFLATILESKFSVLKNPESKNSVIGVSETIIHDLKPEHEIFIVEMGAYKKGEIQKITNLVKPQIGIVTTINEQHLDLFGTLEQTMEAKYELIDALSGKCIAILNADNRFTRKMATMANKSGKTVWMLTKENETLEIADKMFRVEKIRSDVESLSFHISVNHEKAVLHVPLSGEHQVVSVVSALAGSIAAGMSFKDSVNAAVHIRPFRKTMQLLPGIHESQFIDDTFNNNPAAAIAAIDFLAKAKGKKILVFSPMIELGEKSFSLHEEVGRIAGKIADEIILTSNLFSDAFIKGAKLSGFKKTIHISSPREAASFIDSLVKKDDLVLFKGKEAAKVLRLLQ